MSSRSPPLPLCARRRPFSRSLLVLVLAFFLASGHASLLPGLSANDFSEGEPLNIFAIKMVSFRNRLPYDYFTLPFCKPSSARLATSRDSKDTGRLGIGQILQGERSRLTAFDVELLTEVKCAQLCTANFSVSDLRLLAERVTKAYRVRLILDDLPVVVRNDETSYTLGYPLGFPFGKDKKNVAVVNHLDFTVRYHIPDEYESIASSPSLSTTRRRVLRIVGFEVSPVSVADNSCPVKSEGGNVQPLLIPTAELVNQSQKLSFSYSVTFIESKVRWATRFDTLLKVSSGRKRIQVFSIINSMMLALLLAASLAIILFRALRRDCARYGLASSRIIDEFDDDFDMDIGWRALRGDVFRAPAAAGMLSVLCGSGAQLVVSSTVTLFVAVAGIVTPHRRGNLVSGLLLFWILSSGVGGYVAASLHKSMGGVRWKLVTFGVALVLPGIAFCTFFLVNLFLWMMGSIGAAPFLTMFVLLFLWIGVSVPLAFAGTYLGYRRKAYEFPVRTNQIPRPIPRQPKYLSAPLVFLVAGALPFGVVCIELRVILNSIYLDEFYHFFGFLVAMFTILAITCAEVSVVVVFVKLNNCDYGWWWNSWLSSAASGAYVFVFSVYYLLTSPGADAKNVVSNFLFIAYATLGSMCFSLITGTIGFLSSLAFVRRIYSNSSDD